LAYRVDRVAGLFIPRNIRPPGGHYTQGVTEDRFARLMLPHLDAAYAVARQLTRNRHDAEDVVQEAYLRALRYFDGFRGAGGAEGAEHESRAWLLTIVRHTCYSARRRGMDRAETIEFDDRLHSNPLAVDEDQRLTIEQGLAHLPYEAREVIVLRELEGLSYKEIAQAINAPIGTVMSRLARARDRLRRFIGDVPEKAL
jgi:RNA polymerase sigma-70 factor (ECF subfamily)